MPASPDNSTNVAEAARRIRQGHLVAFPTETVYGLGANAFDAEAVARIFEVKRRPTFDPLIVHIGSVEQLPDIVESIPDSVYVLAAAAWPGPLTLVLPRKLIIPDLVTAGLPGVGIRLPAHPLALDLIRQAGCPIAAPSANLFGGISPTTAQHVRDSLGNAVPVILDGGPCEVGVESTVLSLMGEPVVLRPGGFPIESIIDTIGPVGRAVPNPEAPNAAQPSPGMLSRHYAPRTPLFLVNMGADAHPVPGLSCGLLTWGLQTASAGFAEIVRLSADENLRTCAARLFAGLRTLDSAGLDAIIAHRFPDMGLGIALNDRLQRASGTVAEIPALQISEK